MVRISIDIDDEQLDAAREALGTASAASTINAVLGECLARKSAKEFVALLDAVEMDFTGSGTAWRYGGGRDLGRLAERARAGFATGWPEPLR